MLNTPRHRTRARVLTGVMLAGLLVGASAANADQTIFPKTTWPGVGGTTQMAACAIPIGSIYGPLFEVRAAFFNNGDAKHAHARVYRDDNYTAPIHAPNRRVAARGGTTLVVYTSRLLNDEVSLTMNRSRLDAGRVPVDSTGSFRAESIARC